MQYILIYGNLADGHTFVGPFEDYDAAQRYMIVEPSTVDIRLMELTPPASDEGEPAQPSKEGKVPHGQD